jgi:hypothetical protein
MERGAEGEHEEGKLCKSIGGGEGGGEGRKRAREHVCVCVCVCVHSQSHLHVRDLHVARVKPPPALLVGLQNHPNVRGRLFSAGAVDQPRAAEPLHSIAGDGNSWSWGRGVTGALKGSSSKATAVAGRCRVRDPDTVKLKRWQVPGGPRSPAAPEAGATASRDSFAGLPEPLPEYHMTHRSSLSPK